MKKWRERFVLGITGMMGSGKTTVAKIFGQAGALRISADELARFYTSEQSPIKPQLIELFGAQIMDSNGIPERKKIAALVFHDKTLLSTLNQLIHPRVRQKTREMIAAEKGGRMIAWEVPLLFESGADKECNAILTVTTDLQQAEKRVIARDCISAKDFRARIAHQMEIKKKMQLSDFIIENNKDPKSLEEECLGIYHKIMEYRGS